MFLKKLIKNTFIFALGNIFSKVLVVALLPILTGYYSSEEFGYIDFFTVCLSLLIVILGFNTVEYLIKQISQNFGNEEKIRYNISMVMQITLVTYAFLLPILIVLFIFDFYLGIFVVFAAMLQVIENILKQIHRSLDNNLTFISSEIIYSLVFTIILLTAIYLNLNYYYYFIAVILALFVNIVFLLLSRNMYTHFKLYYVQLRDVKKAINFSFPLMLNSIMWYLINLSNRLFLVMFISVSAAGIFSANMRLPLIITLLYSYLYKAIQILIYRNKHEDTEEALNILYALLFIVVIILTYYNDFIINLFLDDSFQAISNQLPIMYITAILSSYASILGINFMISNQTGKAFSSSVYTALCSICLNIVLIPLISYYGAIISMLLSFTFMIIIRIKLIEEKVVYISNIKYILSTVVILLVYLFNNIEVTSPVILIIALSIIVFIYISDIIKIKEKVV